MRSVTLKSAMTPSFMGLMATTLPGVRPSISLASLPTATTSPLFLLMATMEGSLTTIPFPRANTSVFAVPKSMARSEEKRLKTDLIEYPFFMNPLLPAFPRAGTGLSSRSARMKGQPEILQPGLRNDDRHLLDVCATSAILPRDHQDVIARRHGLSEIPELAVSPDIGDCFAVDNQGRARLSVANHFDSLPHKFDVVHGQGHVLPFIFLG